jgi:ribosomal protein L7/L12
MNTITLKLTTHAVLEILTSTSVDISKATKHEIAKCLIDGWEADNERRLAQKNVLNMTVKWVDITNKLRCIKVIKDKLGWGLREAKDFIEGVTGKEKVFGDGVWVGGCPQTLTGDTEKVLIVADTLRDYGCEVVTDSWNC